ncbi:ACD11 homolog protein-like protein, partial [Tanacetum coccineum]
MVDAYLTMVLGALFEVGHMYAQLEILYPLHQGPLDDNNGRLCTGPDDMACRPPSVKDALSGESTRGSDDMAHRPSSVKDALSVSFVTIVKLQIQTPLSSIAKAFEEISDLIQKGVVVDGKEGAVNLKLKPFCEACTLVYVLFGCLGIAFKFAEMEYTAK